MISTHLRIDDHKLLYHPDRVAAWLKGEPVAPIYMEFGLSGACNHRCRFCAFDFLEYKPAYPDADLLVRGFKTMADAGVKSVLFSGEGEPLMHPRASEILRSAKQAGLDVALATNGVLLQGERMRAAVESCAWIKVSIDAGTPTTHAFIHGTNERDYPIILENLAVAAVYRKHISGSCTLGTQAILLPDNRDELASLAGQVRDNGADYLVVKAYSQHPSSKNVAYRDLRYGDQRALAEQLTKKNSVDFQVIFRQDSMSRHENARPYANCLALPFWAHVDAAGDVWACSAHIGDQRFHIGNMDEEAFDEIFTSPRRRTCIDFASSELNTRDCRMGCRMDRINAYLWELCHPGAHVNFI